MCVCFHYTQQNRMKKCTHLPNKLKKKKLMACKQMLKSWEWSEKSHIFAALAETTHKLRNMAFFYWKQSIIYLLSLVLHQHSIDRCQTLNYRTILHSSQYLWYSHRMVVNHVKAITHLGFFFCSKRNTHKLIRLQSVWKLFG